MDPISLGLGVIGLATSLFGGSQQSSIAKAQAQQSQAIAADEQKINAQKQVQMQLEARRNQLEIVRNAQRQRAMGIEAAVNQGAQYGSGLAGALASNTSQTAFGLQGINQGMEIGNNIYGIQNDISGHRQQLAALGGQMSSAQGLTSLGGAIMKSGPIVGAFAKDAGVGSSNGGFNFLFGGGSPSGYGT